MMEDAPGVQGPIPSFPIPMRRWISVASEWTPFVGLQSEFLRADTAVAGVVPQDGAHTFPVRRDLMSDPKG